LTCGKPFEKLEYFERGYKVWNKCDCPEQWYDASGDPTSPHLTHIKREEERKRKEKEHLYEVAREINGLMPRGHFTDRVRR
jgi:hypothetical protein